MSILEILKLALRAIRLNKVRSALTMIGMIIGVAAVIILVSIVSGLGKTIRNELNSFGANLLSVFPGNAEGGGPDNIPVNRFEFGYADLLEQRIPELTDVVTGIQTSGTAKYKNKEVTGTIIQGVTGNYFRALNISVAEGRAFSKDEGSNVVVIGNTLKEKLFSSIDPLGKEVIVKDRRFRVVGVQAKRGSIFGQDQDNIVVIPAPAARRLLGVDRPSFFYIKVEENRDINFVKEKVEKVLQKQIDVEDSFKVFTQEETMNLVNRILGTLSLALGGIAAISLIVGGVGIMNIMLVSVTERTREIGLRKALGARRSDILTQFLIEAVVISLMGGLLGVIVGIVLSGVINNFVATEVNYFFVLLSFGVSALIGIIFGIAPAIRASKLSPIEALRYE